MKKYIAKEDSWYDTGTECECLVECNDFSGLFKGLKDGHMDEEMCLLDEFKIIEEKEQNEN